MKRIITLLSLILFPHCISVAQVGIGTVSPESSAILDVSSDSKALLVPRLLNTSLVSTPVNGMIIYDKSCECFKGYEDGSWEKMAGKEATASVSNDCGANGFEGLYLGASVLDPSHMFSVTISNNSFTNANIAFSNADLQLSGDGVGTVTVSGTSPTSANLTPGQNQLIEYTLSGTPVTGNIEAVWSKLGLNCTVNQTVANGTASFATSTLNSFVFSVNDPIVSVDNQGIFASGSTMEMPYTAGVGTYDAYTSPFVAIPAQYCEDGASDWTFGYSYSSGSFTPSTGNITVTLTTRKGGIETDWLAKRVSDISTINFNIVSIPFVLNDIQFSNTIGLDEGGDAIRGAMVASGCSSCVAYDAANNGDWLLITETEYDQMKVSIANNFEGGTQESDMNNTRNGVFGGGILGNYLLQTTNPPQTKAIPIDHYIYAFKVVYWYNNNNNTTVSNLSLMTGTVGSNALAPVGNVTIDHNINGHTGYYIMKRNSTKTNEAKVVGLHCPTSAIATTGGTLSQTLLNSSPTGLYLTQYTDQGIMLQVLSSDIRQW